MPIVQKEEVNVCFGKNIYRRHSLETITVEIQSSAQMACKWAHFNASYIAEISVFECVFAQRNIFLGQDINNTLTSTTNRFPQKRRAMHIWKFSPRSRPPPLPRFHHKFLAFGKSDLDDAEEIGEQSRHVIAQR